VKKKRKGCPLWKKKIKKMNRIRNTAKKNKRQFDFVIKANAFEMSVANKWGSISRIQGAIFDSSGLYRFQWFGRKLLPKGWSFLPYFATLRVNAGTYLETLELAVPRSVVHHALKIHFHILRPGSRRTVTTQAASSFARGVYTYSVVDVSTPDRWPFA